MSGSTFPERTFLEGWKHLQRRVNAAEPEVERLRKRLAEVERERDEARELLARLAGDAAPSVNRPVDDLSLPDRLGRVRR
jgi:hypothetical protein